MFFEKKSGGASWILVCLGNPGDKYENTRHNVGFMVLDRLASRLGAVWKADKARKAELAAGPGVLLVKPQTYMNLSGESLGGLVDYYKVDEESEFLVVYDDISLDVGQLRIRKKGSAGGHNGMKNIISHLGTEVFPRIKVGVGEKPKKYDLADYVLSRFSKEERAIMEEGCQKAVEAVEMILRGEMEEAMNKFNRKVKPKEA